MSQARLRFLSEEDKQAIHEQTLAILATTGIAYNSRQAIDLLAAAGAQVDHERLTARLTDDLVQTALSTSPREVLLAARDSSRDVVIGGGHRLSVCSDGTATHLLDDATGERLPGSAARLRTVMRLLDALPECDYVWPSLSARDLDPATANLEIEYISLTECAKHLQDEVRGPEFVAPLVDLLEAVAGASLKERPIFSTIDCTVAPLQHDPEMTAATIELARRGVPVFIMPMPLMGTTAPASIIGTCVVTMAELLSTVVLLQLAAPGCALVAAPEPAIADMRSGQYVCGAPEATLASITSLEMCRFYGLPTQAAGLGGDARYPDYQEGVESAQSALLAALAGADSLAGFGTLDGAQSFSLADTVLDNDAMACIRRLLDEHPVDSETSLLTDIADVGPGGHFLGRRSTRAMPHCGRVWQPAVFRRGRTEGNLKELVWEAATRAQELVRTHRAPPLEDDVARYAEDVIARYAETCGAGAAETRR